MFCWISPLFCAGLPILKHSDQNILFKPTTAVLYEVASSTTNPDEVPLVRYTVERFSYQTTASALFDNFNKNLKIPVHYSTLTGDYGRERCPKNGNVISFHVISDHF